MDTDRDQDRPGPNDTLLTDLLVAGLENQGGRRLFQTPLGKGREGFIEPLVEDTDAEGREAVPRELLGDRFHLPGGDAFTDISAKAATNAFSERGSRSKRAVWNWP